MMQHQRSISGCPRVVLWLAVVVAACDAPGSERRPTLTATDQALLATAEAGTLPGSIAVGDDGSANYTIPLDVPAGRAGVQPELALAYNSRAGNGLMGVGWSLSGLSLITRCTKTIAQDGEPRPVRLDLNDGLCLDGKRLVSVGASRYATAPDSFTRVDLSATEADGEPRSFTVYTRDGRILTYGGVAVSRLAANSAGYDSAGNFTGHGARRHLAWLLSRVADRSGNAFNITYGRNSDYLTSTHIVEYWPDKIDYAFQGSTATRQVRFVYDTSRPDPIEQWQMGTLTRTQRRLSKVEVYGPTVAGGSIGLLRSYRLDYQTSPSTKRSLVTAVRVCDNASPVSCLPATTFAYPPDFDADSGPPFVQKGYPGLDIFDPAAGVTGFHVADLNGDGRDDLVYRQRDHQWYVRFGGEDGLGGPVLQTSLPVEVQTRIYSRPQDVDGDGRVDLVLETLVGDRDASHEWKAIVYRATPSDPDHRSQPVQLIPTSRVLPIGYGPNQPPNDPDEEFEPARQVDGGAILADLTGDLRAEAIFKINTSLKIDRPDGPPLTFGGVNPKIIVQDTDGDGRQEILTESDIGGLPAYTSWTLSHATNSWEAIGTSMPRSPCNVFADVNGDGLIDSVNVGNGATLRINTGRGIMTAPVNAIAPGSALVDSWPNCDSIGADGGWRVLDVDEDGRQDLIALGGSMRPIRLLRSLGNSFRVIDLPFAAQRPFSTYNTAQILDVNGDGLTDFLRVDPDTATLWLYQRLGMPADVIVAVTNGLGARDEVVYKNVHTSGAYTPAGCDEDLYPSRCVSGPMQVVVTEKRDNGQAVVDAVRHEYTTSRADSWGAGWLGFAEHKSTDVRLPDPVTTITRRDQTRVGTRYPFHSSPAETLTIAKVEHGYHAAWVRSMFEERETYAGATRFTFTPQTTMKEFEGDFDPLAFDPATATTGLVRNEVTTMTVDDFANPLVVTTDRGDGFRRVRTVLPGEYVNDTASWLIGLPLRVEERAVSPTKEELRTQAFVYTPSGLLSESIREPDAVASDTTLYLRTRYTRNSFGLPTRIDTIDAGGISRFETIAWEIDGVHEQSRTNALGHRTTRLWHAGLDVVVSVWDANSVQTDHEYDGLGRLRKTIFADGRIEDVSYTDLRADGWSFCVRTSDNTGTDGDVCQDRLGRTVVERKKLLDETYARTDTAYDPAGRVDYKTRPYGSGQPVYILSRFVYDGLGRPIRKEQHQATSVVQYHYRGQTFEEIDEVGKIRVKSLDRAGHVVTSALPREDAAPDWRDLNTFALTTYVYGPFDELLEAREPGAATASTLKYDRIGRVLEMNDPDRGLHKRRFNAFGDVVEETDALGRATTYAHDVLGRVKTRTAPHDQDGPAAWDYDPPQGKGKLARSSNRSATRTFDYDVLARPVRTTTVIGAEPAYVTEQTYDSLGRPAQLLYPSAPQRQRFAVESVYSNGYLSEVREVAGRSIWKATEMDASQRITKETINTSVLTEYIWHPFAGLLDGVKTSVGGTLVQFAAYNYYVNGNLHTREDRVLGTMETFAYDRANRLTTAWLGNPTGPSTHWVYDARGNLTSTSEPPFVGCDWKYGSGTSRPHALTSIVCSSGTIVTFGYDANGNVTSIPAFGAVSKARTIEPTPSGRPHRITQGSYVETYGYDPDGVRVTRAQGSDTTHIVGPELERRIRADGTNEYTFYVSVGGRPVAQHIWTVAGTVGTGDWQFLHHNLLDSVELISNAQGSGIAERSSYDVWGRRRNTDWTYSSAPPRSASRYGFTGHKHDDEVGVVDMGGRAYEPLFKRFLSPDPFVQAPLHGPSWNRYSYVFDNPLRYVDPTGFEANLGQAISNAAATMSFAFLGITVDIPIPPARVNEDGGLTIGKVFDKFLDDVYDQAIQLDNEYHIEARAQGIGMISSGFLKSAAGVVIFGPAGALAGAPEAGAGAHTLWTGKLQANVIERVGGPDANAIYMQATAAMQMAVGLHTAYSVLKGMSASPAAPPAGAAVEGAAAGGEGSTIAANKAAGDAFERAVGAELQATHEVVAPQVTIRTPSGTRTRVDFVTRDGTAVGCVECKSSATAPLTKNQGAAFPEIEQSGGVVVGKGKPGVPGGTVIPPGTSVRIRRP